MSLFMTLKNDSLAKIETKIRKSFSAVREELEDHLTAINENTDELKSHSDFLNELDMKIDAINERIESLHLTLMKLMGSSLNDNEKRILQVLDSHSSFLSCKDISLLVGVSELFVKAHLFSMICKGVPLKEKIIDNQSYFALESGRERTIEVCTVNHRLAEF